ncbi:MAG: hypothetical protein QHC40_01450 [Sphingobium sp.]|nr:hypothetical protein [Sphingobium sp.]
MRAALFLFLLAGLAACDGGNQSDSAKSRLDTALPDSANGGDAAEPPGNRVTATDSDANQTVEVAATEEGGAPSDQLPVAFQGRWTGINDRCADAGAEQELKVTPKQLIFHESVGSVARVRRKGDGRVTVEAAFTGEGESWTKRLEMRASGDKLTVSNDGQTVTRKRCGGGA